MTMASIQAAVVAALVVVGSLFLVIGTVGLLRLPDIYNRMHATSKATTLGAASIFLAGAVYFAPAGAAMTSLVGIVFLFLTVPTGAHLISRSAQKMGVEFAMDAVWPEPANGDPGARADGPVEASDSERATVDEGDEAAADRDDGN